MFVSEFTPTPRFRLDPYGYVSASRQITAGAHPQLGRPLSEEYTNMSYSYTHSAHNEADAVSLSELERS